MSKAVIEKEFWFKHLTGDFTVFEREDGSYVCEINVNELPDHVFENKTFVTAEDAARWARGEINKLEAEYA